MMLKINVNKKKKKNLIKDASKKSSTINELREIPVKMANIVYTEGDSIE